MKLYAVIIGRKSRHKQYVALDPFLNDGRTLAIYDDYKRAREAKAETLAEVNHKDVYLIRFVVA